MKKIIIFIILWIIALEIVSVKAWLWWKAPCQTIKDWWFIAQVPGRCL